MFNYLLIDLSMCISSAQLASKTHLPFPAHVGNALVVVAGDGDHRETSMIPLAVTMSVVVTYTGGEASSAWFMWSVLRVVHNLYCLLAWLSTRASTPHTKVQYTNMESHETVAREQH
jgi:hypothetical protein